MEGNRDESEKCLRIAEKYIRGGEREKAIKFVLKADRLFPSERAKKLLSRLTMSNGSAASGAEPEESCDGSSAASPNGCSPGAHGTNASGSTSTGTESTTRSRKDSAGTESKVEIKYTSEQLEGVRRIRKCKDYYEILGVSKDCSEDDLKKSYRKLALKFHPDKNHAPGATEAFKAIGNAFSVLSEPDKRRRYDQYGAEEDLPSRRHSHHQSDYSRGFEGDISAEELFNMFFGGGFPSGNVRRRRMYRNHSETHFHHTAGGGGHYQNDNNADNSYTFLLQLSPILFMILLSVLSSFLVSDPLYSLQRDSKYNHERRTSNLEIPYYVKPTFSTEYKGSLRRLEQNVEDDFLSNLRANCFRERTYKENMMWRARNFNDRKLYEKAEGLKTPSCDRLTRIYA